MQLLIHTALDQSPNAMYASDLEVHQLARGQEQDGGLQANQVWTAKRLGETAATVQSEQCTTSPDVTAAAVTGMR